MHEFVVDVGGTPDRLVERAAVLRGDHHRQVVLDAAGAALLVHRVHVVEQHGREGGLQRRAPHVRAPVHGGGQLVAADGVDQGHARQEAVHLPVRQVLPDGRQAAADPPPRLGVHAEEEPGDLLPEPVDLRAAGVGRQFLDRAPQRVQHRLLAHRALVAARAARGCCAGSIAD